MSDIKKTTAKSTPGKKAAKRKHSRKKKKSQNRISLVLGAAAVLLLAFLIFQINHFFHTEADSEQLSEEQSETLPLSSISSEYFGFDGQFKTYDDGSTTAKLGLDLSSHNGTIDWDAIPDEISFVILRAGYRGYTDGTLKTDEALENNLKAATEHEIDLGIYFFSQAVTPEEAAEEAKLVLKEIQDTTITYPIYFDWEPVNDETARSATISASELTACARAFCDTIESYGYRAGVYFNQSQAFSSYDLLELRNYEFWLADYEDTPSFPYHFSMWQYTNEGICEGIDTNVDLDLYFTENIG